MCNVTILARSAINDKTSKLDATLSLAALLETMITFLPIGQRYLVADQLRNIVDQAERVDVAAHQSLRTDLGGNA